MKCRAEWMMTFSTLPRRFALFACRIIHPNHLGCWFEWQQSVSGRPRSDTKHTEIHASIYYFAYKLQCSVDGKRLSIHTPIFDFTANKFPVERAIEEPPRQILSIKSVLQLRGMNKIPVTTARLLAIENYRFQVRFSQKIHSPGIHRQPRRIISRRHQRVSGCAQFPQAKHTACVCVLCAPRKKFR